jgi:hypothetical protein
MQQHGGAEAEADASGEQSQYCMQDADILTFVGMWALCRVNRDRIIDKKSTVRLPADRMFDAYES